MRNNAIQNRHIYAESNYDDRTALVSSDIESGSVSIHKHSSRPVLPPDWVDSVEEVQRQIPEIKKQITELNSLHTRHLNRPSLDDSIDDEQTIDQVTNHITKMFHQCQTLVHRVNNKIKKTPSIQQGKLAKNVMSSIAPGSSRLVGSF
ncbi:STX16 [Bugula neritina]|uniref:STX16 n=1 Tax=Bugula neritina TaxID=10212 RepID=A0A7J7K967_BUGNE|nr:STX16 [Bugula neritina]